jgi:hypothetical protein
MALLIFAGWGWSDAFKFRKRLFRYELKRPESLRTHCRRALTIALVLTGFLYFREELLTFVGRAKPFVLFGDESTWYGMADALSSGGFFESFRQNFNYQPGIPWLISFPSRLVGVSDAEWLYAYAGAIPFLMFLWIYELSESLLALFAGLSLLSYLQIDSRDFRFYFSGTLYGEATASLLLSILLAETYLTWLSSRDFLKRISNDYWKQSLAWGAGLGLMSMSKAPLSALLPFWLLGAIVWFLRGSVSMSQRVRAVFLMICLYQAPTWIWKWQLSSWNLTQYYSPRFRDFFAKGFNFSIFFDIPLGLFHWPGNGFTYCSGWLAVIAIALLLRRQVLGGMFVAVTLLYWGFVMTLYATYWQNVERNSAGRYCAHVAYACVLLAPLAFKKRSPEAGDDSASRLRRVS